MTNDLITPSWQDVAERWQRAYLESQGKLDRIAALCDEWAGANAPWALEQVRAIIEEES